MATLIPAVGTRRAHKMGLQMRSRIVWIRSRKTATGRWRAAVTPSTLYSILRSGIRRHHAIGGAGAALIPGTAGRLLCRCLSHSVIAELAAARLVLMHGNQEISRPKIRSYAEEQTNSLSFCIFFANALRH